MIELAFKPLEAVGVTPKQQEQQEQLKILPTKTPFWIYGYDDGVVDIIRLPAFSISNFTVVTGISINNEDETHPFTLSLYDNDDDSKTIKLTCPISNSFAVNFSSPMIFKPGTNFSMTLSGAHEVHSYVLMGYYTNGYPSI
jgi:hypothetical protein